MIAYTDFPQDFVAILQNSLGKTSSKLLLSLQETPPTSIRLNPYKTTSSEEKHCSTHFEHIPWAEKGYYLPSRPAFTADPLFHQGLYYVQEASSMAITQVKPLLGNNPIKCLDLCAAPGGKSTLWRSMLPTNSLLIANEPLAHRASILTENLTKWGHPDVIVTNNFPKDFSQLHAFFDVIATDVPCSGEGMFRKDLEARKLWSIDHTKHCQQLQQQIVSDIWPALKEGGLLIYSTCTFNALENEENINFICHTLGAEIIPLPFLEQHTNPTQHPNLGYHFYPHLIKGEGFFISVLRKLSPAKQKTLKAKISSPLASQETKELQRWITPNADYFWRKKNDLFYLEKASFAQDIALLQQHLKCLQIGLPVATLKGKKWQPTQALALSILNNPQAFPTTELSPSQALTFLRKESLVLPPSLPKGYILLTYKQRPLGFVNNIGNRANNLYPDQWRIRSNYTQEIESILNI